MNNNFSDLENLKIALSEKLNKNTENIYMYRNYMDADTYEKFIAFYESFRGSALSVIEYEARYAKEFKDINAIRNVKTFCKSIRHFKLTMEYFKKIYKISENDENIPF